jgi:hypothetical protein
MGVLGVLAVKPLCANVEAVAVIVVSRADVSFPVTENNTPMLKFTLLY